MSRILRSSLTFASFASLFFSAAACGGDRSTKAEVTQEKEKTNPLPTLTSTTPAKLYTGPGPVTLTLHGKSFMRESRVDWNGASHPFTWVDSTTITLELSGADLSVLPTSTALVANPAPGGGNSTLLTLPVGYPVPVLTSLSPNNGNAGLSLSAQFPVVISGSGFFVETRVYWDNLEINRTLVTPTSITAMVPPDLLAFPGSHTIWVKNPQPDGGESNRLGLEVVNPTPVIQWLQPNPAVTGSALSLLVVGTGFTRGSVVRFNGADRPTTYDIGNLYAAITASDLAAPGSASITVYNGPGVTSAPVTLTINPTPLSLVATIPVANIAVVNDSTRGVLYASVPATDPTRANTVVKIDPVAGSIVGSLTVGSDPGLMDISDDSRYLYVALRGQPRIVRIDLATFTKDIEFDPGSAFGITTGYADQLVALPGSPRTVTAFVRNTGAFLFDDSVARINATAARGQGIGPTMVRGPDGSHVYGYNGDNTGFEFFSNRVAADGFHVDSVVTGLINAFNVRLAYGSGLVYVSTGAVVDPVTLQRVGTFPASGTVTPDVPNNRVHFLGGPGTISTFNATSRALMQTFSNPNIEGLNVLTRWGTDGLAIGGGAKLVIMRGSLVAP